MKKISVGLATVALAFLVGCSKGPGLMSDNSEKIIKVNNDVITQNMYDKAFDNAYKSSFLAARNIDFKDPKNKFVALIYKDKAVNELIIKELLKEEAEKRKIEVKNNEIDKTYNEIAEKLGGKDKLEATLTMKKIEKTDFMDNIKTDIMTKKLIESVSANINISDKEAQEFYNKNKNTKFTFPDLVRAKHILIGASKVEIKGKLSAENPNLSKQDIDKKVAEEINKAKSKAQDVLAKVKKNPEKFDELAKQYSDDPGSAEKGGELGFFSQKDMVPEFSKTAFSMLPGNVSDVVETDFGFHIIKVVDRKKAGSTPFNEVKAEIKKFIVDQKKIETLQKILESAKNTAKIEYLDKQYDPQVIQDEIKSLVKDNQEKAKKVESKKVEPKKVSQDKK